MSRIGHKKSRGGCSRCKERKVKCNEGRPCSACIKHRVSCSLVPQPSVSDISFDHLKPRADRQGDNIPNPLTSRPSHEPPSIRPTDSRWLSVATGPFSYVARSVTEPKSQQPSNWAVDLGLMNHYTSLTSGTLPGASPRIWQSVIPREAVSYPFLMHQILAVSAFHLAILDPSQGSVHLYRAFQNQHYAICGIKAEMLSITERNCHTLFAASSLLFIRAFAASTPAMNRTCQHEVDNILDIFTLIRGVSGILNLSKNIIQQGILGEFMQCGPDLGGTPLLRLLSDRLPRISQSFDADDMRSEDLALVKEAISGLRESVETASPRSPELNVAIHWPMTLKDGFLALLRLRHPASLVVLAHYCVILDAVGSDFWFVRGWGHRLVKAIAESLTPVSQQSIRWPMDYIESSIASKGVR